MTIAAMREKLRSFLNVADDKKIAALYVLLEESIEGQYGKEQPANWQDASFVAEMNERYEEAVKEKTQDIAEEDVEDGKYYNHWDDPSFVAEIERRYEEYKKNGVAFTQEEVNERIKRILNRPR